MKTTTNTIGIGALALVLTLPAVAGNTRYDYARVVDVEPLTRIVEVSSPREECWNEEVVHTARGGGDRTGMIVGGIIGGVVGNRFGGGDGRRIATVAGTLLGAGIGDELGRRRDHGHPHGMVERRCRTVQEHHTEERTIGYRVRYRYHGEEYVTRTSHHPGRRIRVRVSVTPEG